MHYRAIGALRGEALLYIEKFGAKRVWVDRRRSALAGIGAPKAAVIVVDRTWIVRYDPKRHIARRYHRLSYLLEQAWRALPKTEQTRILHHLAKLRGIDPADVSIKGPLFSCRGGGYSGYRIDHEGSFVCKSLPGGLPLRTHIDVTGFHAATFIERIEERSVDLAALVPFSDVALPIDTKRERRQKRLAHRILKRLERGEGVDLSKMRTERYDDPLLALQEGIVALGQPPMRP